MNLAVWGNLMMTRRHRRPLPTVCDWRWKAEFTILKRFDGSAMANSPSIIILGPYCYEEKEVINTWANVSTTYQTLISCTPSSPCFNSAEVLSQAPPEGTADKRFPLQRAAAAAVVWHPRKKADKDKTTDSCSRLKGKATCSTGFTEFLNTYYLCDSFLIAKYFSWANPPSRRAACLPHSSCKHFVSLCFYFGMKRRNSEVLVGVVEQIFNSKSEMGENTTSWGGKRVVDFEGFFFLCMCIYFLFVSMGWCFGCHNWMNKFFLCHCRVFSTPLWLISCPVIMFGGERQTLILFNCVRLSKLAAEHRCNVFNLGHQYPHINLNSKKIKDWKIRHNSD